MHRFLKSWMVEKKVEIKAKDIEKLYSGGFPIKVTWLFPELVAWPGNHDVACSLSAGA